jgi:hypothetical protein
MIRTVYEKLLLAEDAIYPGALFLSIVISLFFFEGSPSSSLAKIYASEGWFVVSFFLSLMIVCLANLIGVILRIYHKSLFLLIEYPSAIVVASLMGVYIAALIIGGSGVGSSLAICVSFLILVHFFRSFLSIHLTYFSKKQR